MKLLKVFIIGSGNVAYHMVEAFVGAGIDVSGLYARTKNSGEQISDKHSIPFFNDFDLIDLTADLYLICVSDSAIQTVAASIPNYIKENAIVAHTSGSMDMSDSLSECRLPAIFYPLQTFSKGKEVNYDNIPLCINGKNSEIITQIVELAGQISSNVHIMDDEQRRQIHLSAVMINNFVNHLIYKSESLLEARNIPSSILQPLLSETIKKQAEIGAYKAQTGPARRNDNKTIEKHIALLDSKLDKKLYKQISKSIKKTYK